MAKLYFRYGAMNSGKSTALMQVAHNYEEQGMKVLILKPQVDTKGGGELVSRLGVRRKADLLIPPELNVFEAVQAANDASGPLACVLCDESQFFTPEQAEQLFMVTVDLNIPVICYGLRADFSLKGFPGSTRLLELAHTIVQAQGLCAAEFSSMALLGFLPLLLWAGWGIRPASWNASARVLWWFVAVGGVVCLLGLAGQLHWYRLFTPAQPTGTNWSVPVYAEYFAGALLCSARSVRRTVWLPVWGFAVQAAALLGGALLFGSGAYPRLELLRAWSGGSFSRMDALLLLQGRHGNRS